MRRKPTTHTNQARHTHNNACCLASHDINASPCHASVFLNSASYRRTHKTQFAATQSLLSYLCPSTFHHSYNPPHHSFDLLSRTSFTSCFTSCFTSAPHPPHTCRTRQLPCYRCFCSHSLSLAFPPPHLPAALLVLPPTHSPFALSPQAQWVCARRGRQCDVFITLRQPAVAAAGGSAVCAHGGRPVHLALDLRLSAVLLCPPRAAPHFVDPREDRGSERGRTARGHAGDVSCPLGSCQGTKDVRRPLAETGAKAAPCACDRAVVCVVRRVSPLLWTHPWSWQACRRRSCQFNPPRLRRTPRVLALLAPRKAAQRWMAANTSNRSRRRWL